MNSFRSLFGFNTQLIQYLRLNPLNCIIENLDGKGAIFLGNIYAAYSQDILKKYDITAVLTVAAGTALKYRPEQGIIHSVINADDIEHYNLSRHFDKMIEFIHQNRMAGRNVLVHCFAGISRSSTTVIAYMMKELNFTFRKALAHCKARRKEVLPNNGFQRQLEQFEKRLKSEKPQELQSPPPNQLQMVQSENNSDNRPQRSSSQNKTAGFKKTQNQIQSNISGIIMSGNNFSTQAKPALVNKNEHKPNITEQVVHSIQASQLAQGKNGNPQAPPTFDFNTPGKIKPDPQTPQKISLNNNSNNINAIMSNYNVNEGSKNKSPMKPAKDSKGFVMSPDKLLYIKNYPHMNVSGNQPQQQNQQQQQPQNQTSNNNSNNKGFQYQYSSNNNANSLGPYSRQMQQKKLY